MNSQYFALEHEGIYLPVASFVAGMLNTSKKVSSSNPDHA